MKATGIVRRIDDLGRVVIPKEIRRTLRIREGDPLEIYTDREGEVILKKYSMIGDIGQFAKQYADALSQTTGYLVMVTDRDMVIAASSGVKKDIQPCSLGLSEFIKSPINVVFCFKRSGEVVFFSISPTNDDLGDAISAHYASSKGTEATTLAITSVRRST